MQKNRRKSSKTLREDRFIPFLRNKIVDVLESAGGPLQIRLAFQKRAEIEVQEMLFSSSSNGIQRYRPQLAGKQFMLSP